MGAFAFQNSGGNFEPPTSMFRGKLDDNNTPIFEDIDASSYVVPPSDKYHLRLTGFSPSKDDAIPKDYQKPNGPTTRKIVSLELEIASGRGAGKRFLWNFITFSLGMGSNPSHMGRIYKAGVLNGADAPKGQQLFFDDLINCEFDAYVNASASVDEQGRPKFATLSKDTIQPHREGSATYDPFDESAATTPTQAA